MFLPFEDKKLFLTCFSSCRCISYFRQLEMTYVLALFVKCNQNINAGIRKKHYKLYIYIYTVQTVYIHFNILVYIVQIEQRYVISSVLNRLQEWVKHICND